MLVSQFINRSIPEVHPDTVLSEIFPEDYPEGIGYAPVVKDGKFLGFLDLSDLETEMESHQHVGQCSIDSISISVKQDQHLLEVLPLFVKAGSSVLPVLNEEEKPEGYLSEVSISRAFSELFAFQNSGGILVLSVPAIHYSLSEISRLIEANQAKVLSVLLDTDPVLNQNYLVHLKINQPDLSRIVATLERFEYNVLEVHQTKEASSIDKDRFDQLMRYLDI